MSREIEVVNKKGRANLLFATLVCVPGPLVLAIDLAFGVNSTLIADLIKRSIDLLTVLLAWIIYELTIHNSITSETKARLEVFVKYFTGISSQRISKNSIPLAYFYLRSEICFL